MRISLLITMLAATAAVACSGAGRRSADAGTLDQVVPIEVTRAIRAELPGSHLPVLRHAHALMNEPDCLMALRQNLDAPAAEIDAILHSEQCARFDHVE